MGMVWYGYKLSIKTQTTKSRSKSYLSYPVMDPGISLGGADSKTIDLGVIPSMFYESHILVNKHLLIYVKCDFCKTLKE